MTITRARKLAFSLAAVFLALLLLEGFLRLTGIGRAGAEQFYDNIYDPLSRMVPGARDPYSESADFINEYGLRGPDWQHNKPRGVFRIVCVGDSTTFGTLRYGDSYPKLLQQLLDQKAGPGRFEVINAGIPGTNIYQQRLIFTDLFAGAGVDLVLLMSGPNLRADLKAFRDRWDEKAFHRKHALKKTLSHFAIYRALRRMWKGGVDEKVKDDFQLPAAQIMATEEGFMRDYIEDIRLFEKLADRWGFELVVMESIERSYLDNIHTKALSPDDPDFFFKAQDLHYDHTIFKQAAELGLPVICLSRDFVPHNPDEPGLWGDPAHPGALGNKLIAERVVADLEKLGIIEIK